MKYLISYLDCSMHLQSCSSIIANSLLCGMTVFCNVFSYEYQQGSDISEIVEVLKTNGPFNTGITFIW